MISYKDANGNKQQINRTDVKEMVELDGVIRDRKVKSTAIRRCYIKIYGQTGVNVQEVKKGKLLLPWSESQTNCKTQQHNITTRKPKVHQNTHSDKTFRSGSGSAATIGICW